jgi:HK97 family phage major capsid protein
MDRRFCSCPGCEGCSTGARDPSGNHGKLFTYSGGNAPIRCPACSPGTTTLGAPAPVERRSALHSGRNGMTSRLPLSQRLSITPGSKRTISGDEMRDMQRQAAELEQRASLQVFEPDMYAPGSGHSWFADAARVTFQEGGGDGGVEAAQERLQSHEEYEHRRTDQRLRLLQAERAAEAALTRTRAETSLYIRWSEAGGKLFEKNDELRGLERRYFTPPAWLIDRFVHAPRAGAPLAALMTGLPVPPGTDSINVPQFRTGGGIGTGVQAADGGAVPYRDPTEGTVKAIIQTLAVNLDVSLQLIDQSPVPFDQTYGQDIAEDFAMLLDGQLLLGDGTAGQVPGLISGGTFSAANQLLLQSTNNASSQTWAYNGSGFQGSAHQMTAQLYSKLSRARGLPPTHWVVNPDVWAIISGSADSQNRPLVEPGRQGKFLHGLPIIEDNNLVSSFGGGTAPSIGVSAGVVSPTGGTGTYAPILLGRWSDLVYFTGEPRVQVMQDVLAGSLQVRYAVRQYIAAMPSRIAWGGSNVTYSGTNQSGGLNTGAACAYGAFTQFESNGPLSPSGAGY